MTNRETVNFQPSQPSTEVAAARIFERIQGIHALNQQVDSHAIGVSATAETLIQLNRTRFHASDIRNDMITRVHRDVAGLINSGALSQRESLALYFNFNSCLPDTLSKFECEKLSNLIDTLQPGAPVVVFTPNWQLRHKDKPSQASAGVLGDTPTLSLWKSGDKHDSHPRRLRLEFELMRQQENNTYHSIVDFNYIAVGDQIPEEYVKHMNQYIAFAHKTVKEDATDQLLFPILRPEAQLTLAAASSATTEIFTHLPEIARHPAIQERSRQLANEIRTFTTFQ